MTKQPTSNHDLNQTADQLITMQRRDPGSEQLALLVVDMVYQVWLQIYQVANLPFPVRLGLGTSFASFVVLMTMPHHPLAIPASFGAGLALNLVTVFTWREIKMLRSILIVATPRSAV